MNRREALAGAVLAVGGSAVGATTKKSGVQTLPVLIDERLSGVANLRNLKDNEYGYTSSVIPSRLDPNIQYFATACQRQNMVTISTSAKYPYEDNIICRRGDYFYVKPSERSIEHIYSWKEREGWGLLPGDLANCMAYPLVEKEGDFFKVPASWSECAKHPLVRRNIEALKKSINHYKEMRDVLGAGSLLSCFITDEDLKCLEEIVNG